MKHLYCTPEAEITTISSVDDVLQTSGDQTKTTLEDMLDIHTDVVDRVTW